MEQTARLAPLAALGLAAFATQAVGAPAPTAPNAPTPAPSQVQGVTVNGTAPAAATSIDRRSYTVGQDLQGGSGSVADALRSVPSVQVDVQGNVSLRGDPNVTIMIDGKPSAIFRGPNRGQVLQSIPAGQFERVEVMTNPSAAFSPEGSAGVINLVTRQARGVGLTGSVRANVGTGERGNASLTVANNTQKLTLSGDAGVRRDVVDGNIDDVRTGAAFESRQLTTFENYGTSWNLRGGFEYDADKDNRISGELRHSGLDFATDFSTRFGATGASGSAYERNGSTDIDRSVVGASADWRRKFAGDAHELTLHLAYDRTTDDQSTLTVIDLSAPLPARSAERLTAGDALGQAQVKLEYKRPLPDRARLTLGYELQAGDNRYDNGGARGPSAASLAPDTTLANRFDYDLTVHAFYATAQKPFGKLTVMPGLRLEAANIATNQITAGLKDSYDTLRVFPTLHLQYATAPTVQLNASYSRRIQRPAAQDLNPFRVYQDPRTFRQGDPRLQPQVTDAFELSYQKRETAGFLQATAFGRFSKKGVTDVVRDLGGGVLLTTKANLAHSTSSGVELVANRRLSPKVSYTVSATAAWTSIEGQGAFAGADREGVVASGYAALNLQPTKADFVQVSGFVQGRTFTPQGYRQPTGMLNLGLRHTFSPKLSGVVIVQDALNSFGERLVIKAAGFEERRTQDVRLRSLYVGLTYAFGQAPRRPTAPAAAFDFGGAPGVSGAP